MHSKMFKESSNTTYNQIESGFQGFQSNSNVNTTTSNDSYFFPSSLNYMCYSSGLFLTLKQCFDAMALLAWWPAPEARLVKNVNNKVI